MPAATLVAHAATPTAVPGEGTAYGGAGTWRHDDNVIVPRPVTPLVGRAGELRELADAVDAARDGAASVVVVGGDAGVGKTRLVSELVARAQDRGVRVLVGHCIDLGEAPPPYLAVSEALGRLREQDRDLADELGRRYPAITRLFPSTTSQQRIDRRELFESVLSILGELAHGQPLLLVVEDVHWADQATTDLLGYLFTRLSTERVAIVVTYRADDVHRRHPLRPLVAQWMRLPAVRRLEVGRLTDPEVRALVQSRQPGPDPVEVPDIVRRAEGNPFFAEELLAFAEHYADPQHLPWQLADLLLVRLDRLSDDVRRVAQAAAVAGREVRHDTLAAVLDLPPDRFDAALRDAIDGHVLQLTDSGDGYGFRHALLAEAAYEDLLPGERMRLHAAYAGLIAAGPRQSPAELARHALASHDLPTAFRASVDAAEEAMGLAAPQEAMRHYEAAIDLAPQLGELSDVTADLALALVEAADASGRSMRAAKVARNLLADLPPDATDLVRAKLLYARGRATLAEEIDDDASALPRQALQLLPAEPPSAFRAEVLALHAHISLAMDRVNESQRAAEEAIRVGTAVGASQAVRDAQTTLAIMERRRGARAEAAELLMQVVADARLEGNTAAEIRGMFSLAGMHLDAGELDRAEADYVRILARAKETGRGWQAWGVHARCYTGLIRIARGDWDGARALLDTAEEHPPDLAAAMLASTDLIVEAGRGQAGVAQAMTGLRQFWEREGRIALNAGIVVAILAEQHDDIEAAAAAIDDIVDLLGGLWLDPWFLGRIELSARLVGATASVAGRRPNSARRQLAALGQRYADDGRTAAVRGLPTGRTLGPEGTAWLAHLEAEHARLRWITDTDPPTLDELVTLWQTAIAAFDYGHRAGVIAGQARLATILQAAGRTREAAELGAAARDGAVAMGARPVVDQLADVGAPRDAGRDTPTGLDALTEREREVLGLLVEGASNRRIAGRLYISEKTVSVHVSNILAKLEVRSRNEAAALARAADG